MAIKYQIDNSVNCIFFRQFDTINLEDIEQAFEVAFDDPRFQPAMNVLQDLRQCDFPDEINYSVLSTGMKEIAVKVDEQLGSGRLALVAKDQRSYAKVHQFIVALRFEKSHVERKAFREINEAMKWLGLPENYQVKY